MPLKSQPVNDKGEIEVPVVCATRDFQGAVAETIVTLWNVLWQMQRSPVYCQFQSHGYAFVRAGVYRDLRGAYEKEVIRGFMIDDDILLKSDQQANLSTAIKTADQFNWNFVAPYRVRDGFTSIARENGDLLTVEEVRAKTPFDRIANAGLGFYYGDLPLGYKFHEEGVFGGEDLNFFHDNPQLEPRIVDLGLKHLKVMDIDMQTPIFTRPRPLVLQNLKIKTAEELGIKPGEVRIKE
jgi:hypothetical protein